MDTYIDQRDIDLLMRDKCTFLVLRRIVGASCDLLLTDHSRIILCLSTLPFPVWIWTPDDATPADMARAYGLAKEYGLLAGRHRFNLKYALAEYFIERAAAEGMMLRYTMNVLAYECPAAVRPSVAADGGAYLATEAEVETWADYMYLMHREIGIDQKERSAYSEDARASIASGRCFFWKNAEGANVASCAYHPMEDMASINAVYTREDCRRRHYAENLVYAVTVRAAREGYLPMLYTDADYAASNSCYEKVGYIPRGRLCTIG